MRIGLVVDSACDLPKSFFDNEQVEVLPITVRIGDAVQADHRDEAQTLSFLESHIAERGASAETIPYTPEQIRDLFLERLVVDYDYVFCMTITGSRSPIFSNAQKASYMILNDYKQPRAAAGNATPFALRVIDTQNLFCAQGILPVEAARLRAAGEQPLRIRTRLEELAQNTYGYLVPRDLYYIRNRARHKGDRSVSLLASVLGTAFDIRPVLHCHQGETGPVDRVRGFEPAARRLFDFACERVREGLPPLSVVSVTGLPLTPEYRAGIERGVDRGDRHVDDRDTQQGDEAGSEAHRESDRAIPPVV